MNKQLLLLFTKERLWANLFKRSLKKSDVSKSLWKNKQFAQKNVHFLYVFYCFPPFYAQERITPIARFALVALYKRTTVSESLLSFFTKERLKAICSRRSLQNRDGSNSLFLKKESLFRSCARKKRAIPSKNQRANSQPWVKGFCLKF